MKHITEDFSALVQRRQKHRVKDNLKQDLGNEQLAIDSTLSFLKAAGLLYWLWQDRFPSMLVQASIVIGKLEYRWEPKYSCARLLVDLVGLKTLISEPPKKHKKSKQIVSLQFCSCKYPHSKILVVKFCSFVYATLVFYTFTFPSVLLMFCITSCFCVFLYFEVFPFLTLLCIPYSVV